MGVGGGYIRGRKGAWSWTKGSGNEGGKLLIGKRESGGDRPEKHKGDHPKASRQEDGERGEERRGRKKK